MGQLEGEHSNSVENVGNLKAGTEAQQVEVSAFIDAPHLRPTIAVKAAPCWYDERQSVPT